MTVWIWFLVITLVVSLVLYLISGGADFGAGVWYLFARGDSKRAQQRLIHEAIAPIWEANHVWMILVIVILFVAFPKAFGVLMTALHIPITAMLIGIVLRGSAFVFRAYGHGSEREVSRWGMVFATSSAITPFLLGVSLGAVASSKIVVDPSTGGFVSAQISDFWSSWLHPFAWSVGALVLMLCVYLSAIYLVVEAPEEPLKARFRKRALYTGVALAPVAALTWWLSQTGAPLVYEGLSQGVGALVVHTLAGLSAIGTLFALWSKRDALARALGVTQVCAIIVGWAMAQYPYVIPPGLTFEQCAAPEDVLRPMVIALVLGCLVMLPAMAYLYKIFKMMPKSERA